MRWAVNHKKKKQKSLNGHPSSQTLIGCDAHLRIGFNPPNLFPISCLVGSEPMVPPSVYSESMVHERKITLCFLLILLGDVDGDFPRFFSSLSFFPSRFLSRSSFFKSHGVRLSLFVHSIWFYTRRPLDVKCNRYYFPISTRELCRLFLLSYLGRDHLQFFISSTLDFRDVIFCLLVFVFPVHLVHRWLKIQDSYDLWALNVFRFLAIVLLLRILHYDGW